MSCFTLSLTVVSPNDRVCDLWISGICEEIFWRTIYVEICLGEEHKRVFLREFGGHTPSPSPRAVGVVTACVSLFVPCLGYVLKKKDVRPPPKTTCYIHKVCACVCSATLVF